MTKSELVRLIGLSHLLQPPLTWLLASGRGLALAASVRPPSLLVAGVLHNMAVASVGLPTALGLLLAIYPTQALQVGPGRATAWLVASFWCWRLYRQVFALGPLWPRPGERMASLHGVLLGIFIVQGPVLMLLLLG